MLPESHYLGDEPGYRQEGPLLFHLVYCSRASMGIQQAEVDRIVDSSLRNNPRCGITGMLTFGEGIFFQWLEGPRDSIDSLMAVLRKDSRHGQIVVISAAEESRERLFPDWDMELVGAEHIREVLEDAISNAAESQDVEALSAMLAAVSAQWKTGGAAAA